MAREQVHVTGVSVGGADDIWACARDFLWDWHPLIATMRAERSASGALLRALTVVEEETLYREQLTYFSDTKRCLAYTHLEGIAGVDTYDARLMVTASDTGCVISMSAQISAPAARAREIAQGTEVIFESTIAQLAARTEVRPVPTTAIAPVVPTETLTIDTLPRLALTITPPQNGPLCLFLHGIGGARSNWAAQLPCAAQYMQAAALDLRGYGDSTLGSQPSDVDAYCDDILRVMEVLNADKLVLCGLSYGAWIATSFAMRHADKLSGLIPSGGCTGMSEAGPDERDAFRRSREVPLNAGQTPADFAPAVVEMLCAPAASQAARDALLASMSAIPASTYRDALGCFTNPAETFDFAKLTMPVMLITGEHDRLAPPAEISRVADRIYDAGRAGSLPVDVRYEVLQGAGHVCNVEDPIAYNALLSDFLGRMT